MSIYGKYFVMQYLLICHASLSQSITPLRLAGQKCLAFPTSPLCFPWQFKENRDTLWLLIQSSQTTSAPARGRIYTQLFRHVHERMIPGLKRSAPKSLKSDRSSPVTSVDF